MHLDAITETCASRQARRKEIVTIVANEMTEKTIVSTVSVDLLRDLLHALEGLSSESRVRGYLAHAGISVDLIQRKYARLTHDQFVRLYQVAAVEAGDEMMGLWSRPVRAGALKYLCRNMLDARSVAVALYRFTQVWNLLLDDYHLVLSAPDQPFGVSLQPRHSGVAVNRFGHMLMLKLAHGVVSWLVGSEVPLLGVYFVFARPAFAEDYRVLFPAPVGYNAACSAIVFQPELAGQRFNRPHADLRPFLERAPRDWIFTTYKEHALSLKVREYLSIANRLNHSLNETAASLHISPRTLMRHLEAENTSFQAIKDGLRRDLAILDLINSRKSLDDIAHECGFGSAPVFYRAFKSWTGSTPGEYRGLAVHHLR